MALSHSSIIPSPKHAEQLRVDLDAARQKLREAEASLAINSQFGNH